MKQVGVPSVLHPADPMSRVTVDFGGEIYQAEMAAWRRWDVLKRHPDLCWVQGLSYV